MNGDSSELRSTLRRIASGIAGGARQAGATCLFACRGSHSAAALGEAGNSDNCRLCSTSRGRQHRAGWFRPRRSG